MTNVTGQENHWKLKVRGKTLFYLKTMETALNNSRVSNNEEKFCQVELLNKNWNDERTDSDS